MLKTQALDVFYDQFQALIGVSIQVHPRELLVIIGSNGAGKTTFLRTISGLIRPREGRILWEGRAIEEEATDQICRLGIIQVPEGRKLFPRMTVFENLEMGSYLPEARPGADQTLHEIFELFPILRGRRKLMAGTLSGGEQQMLAMGRALMARPKLLMLDEPSLGLSPLLVREIFSIVKTINGEGITILLVEQNARMALKVADYGFVLENGRIVAANSSNMLLEDEDVREFYLGIRSEESAKGYQRWKRKKRWR